MNLTLIWCLFCLTFQHFKSVHASHLKVRKFSSSADKEKNFAATQKQSKGKGKCHDVDGFEKCLSSFKELTEQADLAFASNSESLQTACGKLRRGTNCADNWMRSCSDQETRKVYEDLVNRSRTVLRTLCKPGKMQKNYLKFAPCLKELNERAENCSFWMKEVQKMTADPSNGEVEAEKFCCFLRESLHCQVDFMRINCAKEATDFFQSNLENMSLVAMDRHCSSFIYRTKGCQLLKTSESPLPARQSFINVLSLLIVYARTL